MMASVFGVVMFAVILALFATMIVMLVVVTRSDDETQGQT